MKNGKSFMMMEKCMQFFKSSYILKAEFLHRLWLMINKQSAKFIGQ